MISKTQIVKNLISIDNLYRSSKGIYQPKFYAKLAIIETCGWIEECMDKIIEDILTAKLTVPSNKSDYRNEILNKTSGFKYSTYFRNKLLKNLIGIVLIEKIEARLDTDADFHSMVSSLNTLHQIRNDNAHTHISGTTISIIAPSVTKTHFDNVYLGLKKIKKELNKIKFR